MFIKTALGVCVILCFYHAFSTPGFQFTCVIGGILLGIAISMEA